MLTAGRESVERRWEQSEVEFEAESPDEAALVAVANAYKYTLVSTTNATRIVNIGGTLRSYELLATLEFDSTRKRMSVLIREGDKVCVLFEIDTLFYGASGVVRVLSKDVYGRQTP